MFKDEYNKQFDEIAPSPALNEETLALMQEAQAHPQPMATRPQKLRWVLPVCVSGAAAMLALTIGLAFWLNKPEEMADIKGYEEFLLGADSTVSGEIGNENTNSSDMMGSAPNLNNSTEGDAENKPNNDTDDGSNAGASNSQAGDSSSNTGNTSSNAGSTSSDANTDADAGDAGASDENKGTDAGDNADPEKTPEDEVVEDPEAEQPESDTPQSTPPAEPVDPKAPVEITDKKTETYLSLRAYLDAIAAKKTIGYKTNYLMEEPLVIVPTWLPTTARFRQVYAYSNGGYTYSYLLAGESESYFLHVAVSATLPKTQRDLQLRVKGVGAEEKLLKKTKNQWIYYFGNYDKAIVTVTTVDGKAVSMEQAAPLLTTLDFARYTVQNGLVEMTY